MIPLPCQREQYVLVLSVGSTRPSLLLSDSVLHLRNSSLRPDFLEGRHGRLEHADECLRLRQCIGFGSATNGREFSATADILDVVVSATADTLGIAVSSYCNEGCKVSRLLRRLLLLVELFFGSPPSSSASSLVPSPSSAYERSPSGHQVSSSIFLRGASTCVLIGYGLMMRWISSMFQLSRLALCSSRLSATAEFCLERIPRYAQNAPAYLTTS